MHYICILNDSRSYVSYMGVLGENWLVIEYFNGSLHAWFCKWIFALPYLIHITWIFASESSNLFMCGLFNIHRSELRRELCPLIQKKKKTRSEFILGPRLALKAHIRYSASVMYNLGPAENTLLFIFLIKSLNTILEEYSRSII